MRRVLVVSGDPRCGELAERLGRSGRVEVRCASAVDDAIELVGAWRPAAMLVDPTALEPGEAERAVEAFDHVEGGLCALLAEEPSGETASEALRLGADTVLAWSVDVSTMFRCFGWEDTSATPELADSALPPFVVGSCPAMREVWRLVFLAAPDQCSVLISGETGAGKEVVARALHRFSARRKGPFVAVNCAALPEGLLESELFGHEKGAFTDASSRRLGRFELADGGTLLLDEIGDLPLSLQAKLLRVLQERTFERLGGATPISVDVRVVAATHCDLVEACHAGRFRADLYYRLDTLTIRVPPLRECREDILGLWRYFVAAGAQRRGRAAPVTSEAVLRRLLRYDWPGNVRELQSAAAHALTVGVGDTIGVDDLPEHLRGARPLGRLPGLLGMTLREVERELILQTFSALESASATAEMIGISTRKVQYRLKQYRLADAADARASAAPADETGTVAGPRVLLAEDDDEMRDVLEEFLEGGGFSVTAVATGRAALEELARESGADLAPDVVLTDVRMPEMTGIQLLRTLRERGSSVPVIVVSAFADDASEAEAKRLGACAFLPKPIDPARLEDALRDAVHGAAHRAP
ncbi:MAG: sigma 54-interacting transcriptional regulator [Sandaracinaceae bacterium]|nr:sigma 54-interacting transcriptional regulator [Sandaracinaceae bacterium]